MKFFNGFCFKSEDELFASYIGSGSFVVSGFSYGAKKAIDYVDSCKTRVDKLVLLSPIFFLDRDESFKEAQLTAYENSREIYRKIFYKNVLYPLEIDISKYKTDGTIDELKELLYYEYDKKILENIKDRGTKIEVYIGAKDKIINADIATTFFKEFATVHMLNSYGHLLLADKVFSDD
jgi:hypothetical protein